MKKRVFNIVSILLLCAFLSACGGVAAAAAGSADTATSAASASTLAAETGEEEISIRLSDKGSTASDESVLISGSTITITQAGSYRVSGRLSDGQIVVAADNETAKVKLILDGVQISRSGSAAIYAVSADKVILSPAEGSVNSLSSTGEFVQTDENNVDAAVFAKCDLNLNGEGTVDISCECGHGVVSKDDLKLKGGVWNISASGKGLCGKDSVNVEDGSAVVDSGDDAVHSDDVVTVSGGALSLASGDDGIHADNTLEISGGSVEVTKSYEGLEATDMIISSGSIDIVAADDGINAAGGNDGSNAFGPFGGDPFASGGGSLSISGGSLTIDAGGDGLDSNGDLIVSGGLTLVSGPTNSGNGAIDYNGSASISGGTVIAVGASGMAENFGGGSTQGCILLNLPSAQAAGSTVSVSDAKGNVLASFTPSKRYQSVVISAEGMEVGGSYTVTAGTVTETVTLDSVIYGSGMGMPMGGPGMQMGGTGDPGMPMGGPGGRRGGMGRPGGWTEGADAQTGATPPDRNDVSSIM